MPYNMKKADMKSITEGYGLHPNRKYGQNFLVDDYTTDKLLKIIDIQTGDRILEIGPGLGALTGKMTERCSRLTAVEIDSGICRYLEDSLGSVPNFTLVHGDFLKTELEDNFTKIVSNLPYYCATEILFTVAGKFSARDIFVMVQKEMADRIMSPPGSKVYGALTVTLGYYYRARAVLQLGNDVFHPRPDVGSTFLHLSRREPRELDDAQLEMFHLLVKSAFWGRRKTLLKTLSESPHLRLEKNLVRSVIAEAGIDEKIRGEELSSGDYIRLALLFAKNDNM
ncbi:MAG: ribosomal RNA small subunit methyltransferase A [Spirochaetae bacterium HGW-Spirochaetae-1]|nr:MAG: ribosomal RNA small subunit methyltransferase A [Spirochaetae bacterium HGW-Spirochaetae-1]